jgi:uncharacterized OsmC-like protein
MSTITDSTTSATDAVDETPQVIRPQVRTSLVTGTATQVQVKAGEHAFTIDEPPALGGTDLGANPVEHLLAALGACQVITYQVWAEKLGIQLDSVDVDLAGDIDLRGFFGAAPGVRPGFQSVEVQVQLKGPESQEKYDELVDVVERHCPVLDNLGNPVPVSATVTTS